MHATIKHVLPLATEMKEKTTINVEGMNCGHCSATVRDLIEELDGIESTEVNLSTKEAKVVFDASKTSIQAIIENINSSETFKATEK